MSNPDLDLAVTVKPDNRPPMVHELKTWQSYFHAVYDGTKLFELRRDDRDFRANDLVRLRETFYHDGRFTGRECTRRITYVLRHEEDLGLKPGFAILSLAPPTDHT